MEQNGQRRDYYSDLYKLVDLLKAMKKCNNRNIKFLFFSFSLSFSHTHKIINIIGKNLSNVKQKLKFLYVYFIECVI